MTYKDELLQQRYEMDYEHEISYIDLRHGYVTARKEHTCEDCGKRIQPGERYFNAVGVLEGDFSIRKAHSDSQYCLDYEDADVQDR